MSAISLVQIRKSVRGAAALNDLSLALEEGAFCALAGPKRSGKSLLLRIIAGFEEADGGEVRIHGRRVNDLAPRERDVALILPSNALYPHMSVYRNVGLPLRLRGIEPSEIDRRTRAALRAAGIGELMDRQPRTLTPAQAFWTATARALARRPAAILLDDPFVDFDDDTRDRLTGELREFHRRAGVAMIYAARGAEAATGSDWRLESGGVESQGRGCVGLGAPPASSV